VFKAKGYITAKRGITRRHTRGYEPEFVLEKLIKARPIKIVRSFLRLLDPGTAAYYCKALLQAYR
jgi:hypothetical protein